MKKLWPWVKGGVALVFWGGIFLFAQMQLPALFPLTHVMLQPRLDETIHFSGEGLRGITGTQHVTTDEKGFRVSHPIDYSHSVAGRRIFVIGGSTTEQIFLDDQKTWTFLLERELRRAGQDGEVIATGVSGTNTTQQLGTLQRILAYHPTHVIFLVGFNDWIAQVKEANGHATSGFRARFDLRESPLAKAWRKIRQPPPPPPSPIKKMSDPYLTLRGSLRREKRIPFHPDQVSSIFSQNLAKMVGLCRNHGLRCLFLTQPHGYQAAAPETYRASFWMTPPVSSYTLDFSSLEAGMALYNRKLLSLAAPPAIATFDLAARFAAGFENFYDEVHFNEGGARRAAREIASYILETGW